MNLCVVSKGSFTKEDYMELYNFFKDDIAKYTDAFDMAFVKDGHVMIMCNVTDEEKFYALFDDPKSKEFDSKFNSTDTVYSLQKVVDRSPGGFLLVPRGLLLYFTGLSFFSKKIFLKDLIIFGGRMRF